MNVSKYLIYYLSVFTLLFYSCKKRQNVSSHFPKNQNIVEIPFQYSGYSGGGQMISSIVIKKDTLRCIIDTGSYTTIVSSSLGYAISNKSKKGSDFLGVEKVLPITIVKNIKWGEVVINNLECVIHNLSKTGADIIIGTDILSHFCVKIDNSQSKIILSKKRNDTIHKNHIKVPFSKTNGGVIFIQGQLSNKKEPLLLDTGFRGEIAKPYNKGLENKHIKSYWKMPFKGLFNLEGDTNLSVGYDLLDFKLGNKIFKDAIASYQNRNNKNIMLGTAFMCRFKSITFDYPNKMVLFELPKNFDKIPGFDFIKDTITAKNVSYYALLSNKINSFGIDFTNQYPFKIQALYEKKEFKITIGDTLVGIDNSFFDKKAMFQSKLVNKKYVDEKNQLLEFYIATCQKGDADFHFLKRGQLVTEHLKRDYSFTDFPPMMYSFLPVNTNWGYFVNYIKKNKKRNYTLHIPSYGTIGKEVSFTYYINGKEQMLTNKP